MKISNREHDQALYICNTVKPQTETNIRGFNETELLSYCAGLFACDENIPAKMYHEFNAVLNKHSKG